MELDDSTRAVSLPSRSLLVEECTCSGVDATQKLAFDASHGTDGTRRKIRNTRSKGTLRRIFALSNELAIVGVALDNAKRRRRTRQERRRRRSLAPLCMGAPKGMLHYTHPSTLLLLCFLFLQRNANPCCCLFYVCFGGVAHKYWFLLGMEDYEAGQPSLHKLLCKEKIVDNFESIVVEDDVDAGQRSVA